MVVYIILFFLEIHNFIPLNPLCFYYLAGYVERFAAFLKTLRKQAAFQNLNQHLLFFTLREHTNIEFSAIGHAKVLNSLLWSPCLWV